MASQRTKNTFGMAGKETLRGLGAGLTGLRGVMNKTSDMTEQETASVGGGATMANYANTEA